MGTLSNWTGRCDGGRGSLCPQYLAQLPTCPQALETYLGGGEGGKKGEGAGRAERESEHTLAPMGARTPLPTERQGQFLQFSEGLPGAEGSRCPRTPQRSSPGHPGPEVLTMRCFAQYQEGLSDKSSRTGLLQGVEQWSVGASSNRLPGAAGHSCRACVSWLMLEWQPEISHGGSIYTVEIGQCYKSGFPHFGEPGGLPIYQHTTGQRLLCEAGSSRSQEDASRHSHPRKEPGPGLLPP